MIKIFAKKVVDQKSEDDTNFYLEEAIESLLENDEISPEEEAFMMGYGDY